MSIPQNSDEVVQAIRPTLDLFVTQAEPALRKAVESIYEGLLYNVQDYLRENAEWNLGAEIDRCRKIEVENVQLRMANLELVDTLRWLARDADGWSGQMEPPLPALVKAWDVIAKNEVRS